MNENNVIEVYMRDPDRIRKYCDKLAELWEIVPDWRFGQLMSNMLGAFVSEKNQDIFFPEDDELFRFFEHYFNPDSKQTVNEIQTVNEQ